MVTQLYNLKTDPTAIAKAAQIIRMGGLVAFPTETVYGLGADATDADAVAKIFAAKQRALNDPLIVHCAPMERRQPQDSASRVPSASPLAGADLAASQRDDGAPFERLGNMAPVILRALQEDGVIGALTNSQRRRANALIGSFWPGPLTLVLPRGNRIPLNVTAGLDSVAVRMPAHKAALELIQQSGVPIAAPSANRFGHVSPTLAQHVLADLDGRIDMVLDGGATHIGVESTVIDLTMPEPLMLRPGGLTRAAIEGVIGFLRVTVSAQNGEVDGDGLPAPGMLLKHYAPKARLHVVADMAEMTRWHADYAARGMRAGVLLTTAQAIACPHLAPRFILGDDVQAVARFLYAGLRALDNDGVDVILINAVDPSGIGEAVADRLRRGSFYP